MLPNIIIEGRAVADSELRVTANGRELLNFRVAASDSKKDERGEWQTTEQIFINVTLWDEAEKYASLIQRGSKLTVVGRLFEREYEKKDGSKGRSLEIKYPMVKVHQDRQQGQGYQQPAQTQQQGWGQQPTSDPWAAPGATGEEPPF